MLRMTVVMTILFGLIKSSFACTGHGEGFLPENDLYISPNVKSKTGMSKKIFNKTIDKVIALYRNEIRFKQRRKLVAVRLWEDGKVNASARRTGDEAQIWMYGGMARHPMVTPDAFALVVCHELGHHLGGAPKKFMWGSDGIELDWSSVEGQADYFAATKCLKKLFKNEEENKKAVAGLDLKFQKSLSKVCKDATCQRIVAAGWQMAKTIQSLKKRAGGVNLFKKSSRAVGRTYQGHPRPQCRMDTFIAGAKCIEDKNLSFDEVDPTQGACVRAAKNPKERAGARPSCWYAVAE